MNHFDLRSRRLLFNTASVCLALLLAITTMFLWGEVANFSIHKPIDHEKFSSYFTCVGFLIGICSLIGLYIQLSRAEDDRHQNHRPKLIPKSSKIIPLSNFGQQNPVRPPFVSISQNHSTCFVHLSGSVSISNIGLGIAEELSTSWHYDARDTLDFLKARIEYTQYEPERDALDEMKRYLTKGQLEPSIHITFVDKNESVNIPPPLYYILTLLNTVPGDYVGVPYFPKKPPRLIFTVKYRGIYGKQFEDSFDTKVLPRIEFDENSGSTEIFQLNFERITT